MLNRIINNEGSGAGEWTLLSRIIWLKATVLASGAAWNTISGAIVSFVAQKAHALKQVVVDINPVQAGSGDPSPDNVRPISGWTGVSVWDTGHNVWDEQTTGGYINSSTGAVTKNPAANSLITDNYIPIKEETEYIVIAPINQNVRTRFYDASKAYLGYNDYDGSIVQYNRAFKTPSKACFLMIEFPSEYGTTYNHDISINYPSTDTEYHAYVGNTYAIDWTDEAGTVYGGTLTINEDGSGSVEVKTIFIELDGTEAGWTKYSTQTCYNPNLARLTLPATGDAITGLCSYIGTTATGNINSQYLSHTHNGGGFEFRRLIDYWGLPNNEVSTWTGFLATQKAAGKPVQVLAYLQTPITYTLTAQQVISALQGYNAMWADTGDVTVTFRGTPVVEPDEQPLQALNLLLGGAYRNNQTPDDVSDEEALDILLGGADR